LQCNPFLFPTCRHVPPIFCTVRFCLVPANCRQGTSRFFTTRASSLTACSLQGHKLPRRMRFRTPHLEYRMVFSGDSRSCDTSQPRQLKYDAGATVEVTADFRAHTLQFSVNGQSEAVRRSCFRLGSQARIPCLHDTRCASRYRYPMERRYAGPHASTTKTRQCHSVGRRSRGNLRSRSGRWRPRRLL
jgi:hypothetical protein